MNQWIYIKLTDKDKHFFDSLKHSLFQELILYISFLLSAANSGRGAEKNSYFDSLALSDE